MTPNLLQECRDYLQQAYRDRLGVQFSDSISQIQTGRQPVWRWVSADDLVTEVEPGSPASLGLLLDPEIGLLCYLAPFGPSTDLRKQITCALALRARLSIEEAEQIEQTGQSDNGDPRGAWQVVLHWLVDWSDREAWIREVAELRRETRFSDAVSLDAVFFSAREDIGRQLAQHGFPRLLLVTREVFRKQRMDELARWMSADDLVRRSLAGFPSRFEKPEQAQLAQAVVRALHTFSGAGSDEKDCQTIPAARPRSLRTIRVQNFRNLRDLTLDFGRSAVTADIIHGANGTGKSSVCEAISIALFGLSSRYKTFSDRTREKDVSATDRAREYVTKYITPLGAPGGEPRIAVNEEAVPLQLLPSAEVAEAEATMGGTVLMQDMSLEFAGMSAQELGARVLRGYSGLAEQVEQYVESQFAEANANRQDFLRSFGLSASITKLTTAYERIARREIDRSLPGVPRALTDWLEAVPAGEQLAWRWREWGDEPARAGLAGRLSFLDGSPSSMREEIRSWLEGFNSLAAASAQLLKKIEAQIGPLRDELDQAVLRITTWGQWLERPVSPSASTGSAEVEVLTSKLQALQAEQGRVMEQGREAGRHLDHLNGVEGFVKEHWGKHPAECPTCGADHAGRGGIQAVIRALAEQAAAERERLRGEYSLLKRQIDEAQRRLGELGEAQCPVSPQDQSRLADSLGWMIPAGKDFAQWIAVRGQREQLLALLAAVKQKPAVPALVDAEGEGERVERELASQFKNAGKMFESPTNWRPVKESLTGLLADIVNTHLPRTLAALWSELYLNLTSAPWLLPERPSIDVASRRGEQRSTLHVGNRLARYILNQSEVHILGLGWFFTRYMTRGRFSHTCLVMDDPAHELDQSSFGDLCRLWQILLRLHRVYGQPLKLVVMLGQESRAIEAARATGGNLSLLGWTPEQNEPIRPARAVPDGWQPPNAVRLFKKAAS